MTMTALPRWVQGHEPDLLDTWKRDYAAFDHSSLYDPNGFWGGGETKEECHHEDRPTVYGITIEPDECERLNRVLAVSRQVNTQCWHCGEDMAPGPMLCLECALIEGREWTLREWRNDAPHLIADAIAIMRNDPDAAEQLLQRAFVGLTA